MDTTESVPMTVLLDTGIFSHSEFSEAAVLPRDVTWGGTHQTLLIHGIQRKAHHRDPDLRVQINALPTIGRLIREGVIEAYGYREIWCERMRFRAPMPFGNALRDCDIAACSAPVERTKFRATTKVGEYLAKGGKKDRKRGMPSSAATQISFLKFLSGLDSRSVEALILNAPVIGLTDFEVESLREIEWFQFLCERCGSQENYPDVFHLWAAERNRLQVLLTLDNGLPELVSRIRNERTREIEIRTQVLRPLELLHKLGIARHDPVALQNGRFYHLHEVD